MDSIIEQLQQNKEYTVTEIGGEGEKVNTITNYRAINSKTHEKDVIHEIATADLVSLSFHVIHSPAVTTVLGHLRCWTKYSQVDCPSHRQGN